MSEAIEVFDRLRRDHPEMSEPWSHLAVLYAAEGRFDEARETLLAALERRPSAAGYTNLGDLYGKLSGKLSGELARRADPRAGERTAPGSAHPPPGEREGAALSPARDDPGRPAAQAGCLRAGGFHDRRVLAEVEEWMESRGAEVFELRRVRDRRVGSRQVYLPPLGSRAEAAAKLREIRARGVRDVAIIKSGPLENGISFGVFGSPENVRRRVAALEQLGIPVRRRDDWVAVHVYYVEARAGRDPDGLLAAWPDRFPERVARAGRLPLTCPPAGMERRTSSGGRSLGARASCPRGPGSRPGDTPRAGHEHSRDMIRPDRGCIPDSIPERGVAKHGDLTDGRGDAGVAPAPSFRAGVGQGVCAGGGSGPPAVRSGGARTRGNSSPYSVGLKHHDHLPTMPGSGPFQAHFTLESPVPLQAHGSLEKARS